MAPVLSKYVSRRNALVGSAVVGAPLLLYLLKKYAFQGKKTIKRYIYSQFRPEYYFFIIFFLNVCRRAPENDIQYLIVDVSLLFIYIYAY